MNKRSKENKRSYSKKLQSIKKRFNEGCVRYDLFDDGDHILIALSGGKDSLMMCRLMAERAKIFRPKIHVEAIHVSMENIPYQSDKKWLEKFCDELGIKLHVVNTRFEERENEKKTKCFLCSWYRRKALFEFAVKNGFNKVAFGHHQDDIITTWLMNLTFEGNCTAMLPILPMKHYDLTIIRPMCLIDEASLAEAAEELNFVKQKQSCPFEDQTRRRQMNEIFHQIESINKEARYSLWQAMMESGAN